MIVAVIGFIEIVCVIMNFILYDMGLPDFLDFGYVH